MTYRGAAWAPAVIPWSVEYISALRYGVTQHNETLSKSEHQTIAAENDIKMLNQYEEFHLQYGVAEKAMVPWSKGVKGGAQEQGGRRSVAQVSAKTCMSIRKRCLIPNFRSIARTSHCTDVSVMLVPPHSKQNPKHRALGSEQCFFPGCTQHSLPNSISDGR